MLSDLMAALSEFVNGIKAEGSWTITAAGQDYFKYNRSEFIVDVPFVRGIPIPGLDDETVCEIRRPKGGHLDTWYKPLFDYDEFGNAYGNEPAAITAGSIRQKTRGSIRPRNLQASPYEQELEVKSVAYRTLNKLPRVDGTYGSEYGLIME